MCFYFLRPSFLFLSCHVFEASLTFDPSFSVLHIFDSPPNGFFSQEELGLLILMSYFLLGQIRTTGPSSILWPLLNSSNVSSCP